MFSNCNVKRRTHLGSRKRCLGFAQPTVIFSYPMANEMTSHPFALHWALFILFYLLYSTALVLYRIIYNIAMPYNAIQQYRISRLGEEHFVVVIFYLFLFFKSREERQWRGYFPPSGWISFLVRTIELKTHLARSDNKYCINGNTKASWRCKYRLFFSKYILEINFIDYSWCFISKC